MYEAHTGKQVRVETVRFLDRILVERKDTDPKAPRFKVAWFVGMRNTDVLALGPDGRIVNYGSWRVSPEGGNEANLSELKAALNMVNSVVELTPGCDVCNNGPTKTNKGQHGDTCRNRVLDSGVASSYWRVERYATRKRLRSDEGE